MSILGFDLGTGSCKGVAFDSSGNILAKAEKGYDTYSPNPGWCELDPMEFVRAVREVCLSIREKIPHDEPVAAAFSSHGETIIPAGFRREPSGPAYMNADNRAFAEVDELVKKIPAKRIYEITGTPHPMYGLANILWVKEHEPERYQATDKFCPPEAFLMVTMGFDPVCNYSNCCRNMAFDIRKKEWSREILDAAGVDIERMCIPVPSGQLIGKLDREHAALFGLPEGVSIVTGGFDHFSTSIGSGAVRKGMVSCSCGTYEGLTSLSDEPNTSDEAFDCCLNTFCHLDGRYSNFVYVPAGMGTKWIVNEICKTEKDRAQQMGISVYQRLAEKVKELPQKPTELYFLPSTAFTPSRSAVRCASGWIPPPVMDATTCCVSVSDTMSGPPRPPCPRSIFTTGFMLFSLLCSLTSKHCFCYKFSDIAAQEHNDDTYEEITDCERGSGNAQSCKACGNTQPYKQLAGICMREYAGDRMCKREQ